MFSEKTGNLNLRIGEVGINIAAEPDSPPFEVTEDQQRFMGEPGPSHVTLKVHYGEEPAINLHEKVFDAGFWTLFKHNGGYALEFTYSLPSGSAPLAVWDNPLHAIDFFMPQGERLPGSGRPVGSLSEILDPLLINLLLAERRMGMIMHACGIDDGGLGLLFPGASRAGKSTMAKLWQKAGATVLCDDRVILHRLDGRFWLCGTPWCSYPGLTSPGRVPLSKLYFLKHAPDNAVEPLTPAAAAAQLLTNCFPPFHDQEALAFILEFSGQLASEIPAYELGFVPDQSAVEFLRSLK